MNRYKVEHVVKSAGKIAETNEVVVIGSNAIYGSIKSDTCNFFKSMEVDVTFLSGDEEKSREVDGAIGEKSMFHRTHRYYAHGVSIDTATLPDGWQDRLKELHSGHMGNIKGLCISAEDLAASKLVAGRPKDFEFVSGLFKNKITTPQKVKVLIEKLPRKKDIALRNMKISVARIRSKRMSR